jgi:hypothetical protein
MFALHILYYYHTAQPIQDFSIGKASSTVVTVTGAPFIYTGLAQTQLRK